MCGRWVRSSIRLQTRASKVGIAGNLESLETINTFLKYDRMSNVSDQSFSSSYETKYLKYFGGYECKYKHDFSNLKDHFRNGLFHDFKNKQVKLCFVLMPGEDAPSPAVQSTNAGDISSSDFVFYLIKLLRRKELLLSQVFNLILMFDRFSF